MSDVDIDYQIVRSARRKTVSLQVKAGQVVVRAPNFVDEHYINQLINDKYDWLKEKINHQIAYLNAHEPSSPIGEGSVIWVAGKQKTLSVLYTGKAPVRSTETHVILYLPRRLSSEKNNTVTHLTTSKQDLTDPRIKQAAIAKATTKAITKALEEWFKAVAHEYLPNRIERLSQETQLTYNNFQIKKYKARWGSCNSRKELSFNYLLMMLPAWVIDYVIIHELCHLKHLNHSRDFWQLVAHFSPSYLQAKKFLKQYQDQLIVL